MLYDKRAVVGLADEVTPTGTAAESAELDIANESLVALHVFYEADGSGKTLRLYPEVRLPLPGVAAEDLPWVPALSASLDVSGATVDAAGYLPLPGASPVLEVAGISGVEVLTTLHLPVPTGDRFRVRHLEDGYDVAEPAALSLYAAAVRGAP
jgi:hypothetical protein